MGAETFAAMAAIAAVASAGTSAYTAYESAEEADKVRKAQEEAQLKAEKKQAEADFAAEEKRLSALAEEQTKTDYSNAWGVDSVLANRYADTAKKLEAGTGGGMKEGDDDNPFYSRGLF